MKWGTKLLIAAGVAGAALWIKEHVTITITCETVTDEPQDCGETAQAEPVESAPAEATGTEPEAPGAEPAQ